MKKIIAFLIISVLSISTILAQQTQEERLALQYYRDAEYEKAKEILSKIYNKQNSSYLYTYYYHTLIHLQDYDELLRVAKSQFKKNSQIKRYHIDLAYAYEVAGEHQKAEKEYNLAIKTLKPNVNAIRELYSALLNKAKRAMAIDVIQKGRKMVNDPKLYSKELTRIYNMLNLSDKVIEEAISLVTDDDQEYLPEAEEILQQLLLDDEDKQKYLLAKGELQKAIQKQPNNFSYVSLLYWALQLNKEFDEAFILAKSVDKRSKSNSEILHQFATVAANNREYDLAIEALEYIINQGEQHLLYTTAQYEILDVKYLKLTSTSPVNYLEAVSLEQEFKTLLNEHGVHSGTADWVEKYALLLAYYVNKPEEAITLLNDAITDASRYPKIRAKYKTILADILLFKGDVWDATLLYSQVDKELPNDTIGQLAKFKNAKLSFYIGEFGWALNQLDILRAATTKLIANDAMYLSFVINDNLETEEDEDEEEESEEEDIDDLVFNYLAQENKPLEYYAKADFMMFKNDVEGALNYLDSVFVVAPYGKLNDDVYFLQAQILTKKGKYFEAEKLYQQILEAYGSDLLADDALFYLAELYDYYLKDINKAMDNYQQLLKEHPDTLYAVDARKRFRTLRGDAVN